MHDSFLKTNLDVLLFGLPMVGVLFICYFRLDELVASPKRRRELIKRYSATEVDGRMVGCDPDGKPWKKPAAQKSTLGL